MQFKLGFYRINDILGTDILTPTTPQSNLPMNKPIRQKDVFICFSKARPGEAKVAIALKDELEQLGLFAFEYEDWSWVDSGISNEEPEVDRSTLRHMLTHISVVVLISPHSGLPSEGVQKEIEELRSCKSPVILLHWSPGG